MNTEIELLRRYSRQVVREYGFLKGATKDYGVSHSDFHALLELRDRGPMTVKEMASVLRLDNSTASRLISNFLKRRWVKAGQNKGDRREKRIELSETGAEVLRRSDKLARDRVEKALSLLNSSERETVLKGTELYAKALTRSAELARYTIRRIKKSDDKQIAQIIRRTIPEFGIDAPGTPLEDGEIKWLSESYGGKSAFYAVVLNVEEDKIVGGGGLRALSEAEAETCEIGKMYLIPETRGMGLGQKLLSILLTEAKERGFKKCYLETSSKMLQAITLYKKLGFKEIRTRLGNTGHVAADRLFIRSL